MQISPDNFTTVIQPANETTFYSRWHLWENRTFSNKFTGKPGACSILSVSFTATYISVNCLMNSLLKQDSKGHDSSSSSSKWMPSCSLSWVLSQTLSGIWKLFQMFEDSFYLSLFINLVKVNYFMLFFWDFPFPPS